MDIITCRNGVRIVYERVPAVHSASLGIWVANGSRCETARENGVSHFIEHMLFKGTPSRSASDIAAEMDRLGGQFNAYTSKENTTFYFRTLDEQLPAAIDVLADMFFRSLFRERDLSLERTVVFEEIDMVEDTPDELVSDKLAAVAFDGSPLGYPIIGTRETLSAMTGETLHAYMDAHYVPGNVVVSLAGSFDDAVLMQLQRTFEAMPVRSVPAFEPAVYRSGESFTEKQIEQNHICLGFPGVSHRDPQRFESAVFTNILGGGMSSRLFQRVREDAGLCYSIYTYQSVHADTGLFGVYTALTPANMRRAEDLIREVIDGFLQDGPTQEELDRTKGQIRSNLLMGLESTMSRMNRMGQSLLFLGEVPELEETLARYDAVTAEGVTEFARKTCDYGRLSRAVVGKAAG